MAGNLASFPSLICSFLGLIGKRILLPSDQPVKEQSWKGKDSQALLLGSTG